MAGPAWLLAPRVLQGGGAALVMGSTPALVTMAVPARARDRALGYFQMGAAIGLAIGPVLGGLLLGWSSWRAVFLLRVPVALAVLAFVAFIPSSRAASRGERARRTRQPLDLAGALLVGAGLAAGLLALSRGGTSGWGSPVVVVGLLAAVVLLATWVAVERRSSNPVLDLSLLRNTRFTIANILNVVANRTMFAIWLLTPYYLVTVRGLSTIAGGLMLGVAPLATAVAAPVSGRLLGRVTAGRLSSCGLALEAAGLVSVAFTDADTPLVLVAGTLVHLGAGLGLFTVPNLMFVMGSITRDRQGVAGALSQMMRMVGVVAGVIGATLWFDARRSTRAADLGVASDDAAAFGGAYRDTFLVVGVLCALAIAISILRRPARVRLTTRTKLPIGVMISAASLRDDLLIRVAAHLEDEMPWANRDPSLCAGTTSADADRGNPLSLH